MAGSRETMLWPAEGSKDPKSWMVSSCIAGSVPQACMQGAAWRKEQKKLKHLKHNAARGLVRGLS